MIIHLTNGKVKIKWRYDKGSSLIITYCDIIGSENCMGKVTGAAYKAPIDNHNKQIARKLSLKRALEKFSYDDKKIIWKTYGEQIGFT